MKYQNYEYRNLRRFSDDIQEQHSPSLWGTHAATYLLLTYTVFVICITKIYVKTRFKKTESQSTTLKITGSSLGASAAIYACLLIPVLPLATKVFRLSFLYEDRECFKDDKYMLLNEDEEFAVNIPLYHLCVACLIADLAMIALYLVVYGHLKFW